MFCRIQSFGVRGKITPAKPIKKKPQAAKQSPLPAKGEEEPPKQEVVEPSAIVAPEPVEEATAVPSAPVNTSGSGRKRRRLQLPETEEANANLGL